MKTTEIPEILIEKYVLGELTPAQSRKMKEALQNDPSLQSRIDVITVSNREILEKYSPEMFTNIVTARLSARKKPAAKRMLKGSFIRIAAPVLTVFMIFSGYLAINNFFDGNEELEITAIKGDSIKLEIYRKEGNENIFLESDSTVKSGDLIQLQYFIQNDETKKYGVIFSIDGNRNITKHFPYSDKNEDTELETNKETFLQNAYQLDDAPDFEIFYFITADRPVEINSIYNQLQNFADKEKNIAESDFKFDSNYAVIKFPLKKRQQ